MRLLRFAIIFVVAAIVVLATPSACPTSPNGTDLNTLNGDGGCFQIDFTFSSFLSGAGGSNTLTIPTESDIFLWAAGGVDAATANFNTPGPGPIWSAPGDNTGGELDAVLSYVVTTTEADLSSISFGDLGFTGNGLIDVVQNFCLGATTVVGCTLGNGGSITTVIFNGAILSQDGPAFFTPGFQTVAVSEEIIIPNINGLPTALTEVETTIGGVPEPASFLLLGAGLGAIALAGRKRVSRNRA